MGYVSAAQAAASGLGYSGGSSSTSSSSNFSSGSNFSSSSNYSKASGGSGYAPPPPSNYTPASGGGGGGSSSGSSGGGGGGYSPAPSQAPTPVASYSGGGVVLSSGEIAQASFEESQAQKNKPEVSGSIFESNVGASSQSFAPTTALSSGDFKLTNSEPGKLTYTYTGADAYKPEPEYNRGALSFSDQAALVALGRQADIAAIYAANNYQIPQATIEAKYEQFAGSAPGYEKEVIKKLPTLMGTGKAYILAAGGDINLGLKDQPEVKKKKTSQYSLTFSGAEIESPTDVLTINEGDKTYDITRQAYNSIKDTYQVSAAKPSTSSVVSYGPNQPSAILGQAIRTGQVKVVLPKGESTRGISLIIPESKEPSKTSIYYGTPASKFVPLVSTKEGKTIGVSYSVQSPGVVSSIETPENNFKTPEGATIRVLEFEKGKGIKDLLAEARQPKPPPTQLEKYTARSQAAFGAFNVPVVKEVFGGLDSASDFLYSRGEQIAAQQEKYYPGIAGQITGAVVKYPAQVASGFLEFPRYALESTGEAVNIAGTTAGAGLLFGVSQQPLIQAFAPKISQGLKEQSYELAGQAKEGVISKGPDVGMTALSLFGGQIAGSAVKSIGAAPALGTRVVTKIGGASLLEAATTGVSKLATKTPVPIRNVAGASTKVLGSAVEPALVGVAAYTTLENPREAGKFFAPSVAGAGAKFLFEKPVAEIVGSKTVVLMEKQTTTPSGIISQQTTFAKGAKTPKGAQFTFESPVLSSPQIQKQISGQTVDIFKPQNTVRVTQDLSNEFGIWKKYYSLVSPEGKELATVAKSTRLSAKELVPEGTGFFSELNAKVPYKGYGRELLKKIIDKEGTSVIQTNKFTKQGASAFRDVAQDLGFARVGTEKNYFYSRPNTPQGVGRVLSDNLPATLSGGQVPAIKTSINWGKGAGRAIPPSAAESNVAQEVLVTGKGRGELIAVQGQSRFEKATSGVRDYLGKFSAQEGRVGKLGVSPTVRSSPAGTYSFDFRTQVFEKPRLEFTPTKQLQGVEFKTDIEGYANLFQKGQPTKSVPFKQTQFSQTSVKQLEGLTAKISRTPGAVDIYRPAKVQATGRTDITAFEAQPKKFAQGPSEIPILRTYTEGTLGGKKVVSYGESVDLLKTQTPIGEATLSTGSMYNPNAKGKFVYSSQMDTAVIDVRGKPVRSFQEWGEIIERGEPIPVQTQPPAKAKVYRQEYPNPYNRLEAGQVRFEPTKQPLALPAKASSPVLPPGAVGEGNVWFQPVSKSFKPSPTFTGLKASPTSPAGGSGTINVKTSGGAVQIQKNITKTQIVGAQKESTKVTGRPTETTQPKFTKPPEGTSRPQDTRPGQPQANVRVQSPSLKISQPYRPIIAPPQLRSETTQKPKYAQTPSRPQDFRTTTRGVEISKKATVTRQATIQRTAQVQRQPTVQRQATIQRPIQIQRQPGVPAPPTPRFPEIKIPPVRKPRTELPPVRRMVREQPRPRPRLISRSGSRSVFADIISVTQSQLKYGKATSASLIKRPAVWKYTENAAGFVPTLEQLEARRKR